MRKLKKIFVFSFTMLLFACSVNLGFTIHHCCTAHHHELQDHHHCQNTKVVLKFEDDFVFSIAKKLVSPIIVYHYNDEATLVDEEINHLCQRIVREVQGKPLPFMGQGKSFLLFIGELIYYF